MAVQIQLRRDLAAVWTSVNPTLAQGELGIETDTDLAKMGNGVDDWVTLPYWPSGGGVLVLSMVDRIALTPSVGTLVYDTDLLRLFIWQGIWVEV